MKETIILPDFTPLSHPGDFMHPYMRMPFTGIVSFLGSPVYRDDTDLEWADIVCVGIPYDMATTNKTGAREGPRAIREATMLYTYHACGSFAGDGQRKPFPGLYDIEEEKTILKDYNILDAGDIPILPSDPQESVRRITESVQKIFSSDVFPFFLGGDHAITFPILSAIPESAGPIHIIHFDTHLDVLEELDGARYTHGSPFRHALGLPVIEGITQIGIRGILNDEIYHEEMKKRGTIITTYEIKFGTFETLLKKLPTGKRIYISIDIDVFDPSFAPGTGTPEPGGLTYWDVRRFLRYLLGKNECIGFDIVEVAPGLDPTGRTAHLAGRLAIDILGYIKGNKYEGRKAIRNKPRH